MFKSASLPNKEFATKLEMFRELKANKERIINLKKGTVKQSDPTTISNSIAVKGVDMDEGFIYPVINTTNVQDQHGDIHLKGIWNKSAKEQAGKVHYLINHKHEIGSVIAYPKDVEIQVNEMKWSDLGESFEGTTEALTFKTNVFDYSNSDAANVIKNRIPMQNSISMIYMKIELAINSNEKEFKEEKSVWDKYFSEVANKETLLENGHGYFVSEAKIHREGSMVLAGSNHITPILYPKENKSLSDIVEFAKKVGGNLTNENFNYFCTQLKALEANEAVDLTLPKQEPQSNNSKQFYLTKLKTKK